MTKKKVTLKAARPKKKTASDRGPDNIFRTVVLAARRAKEIFMGDKPLIETHESNPCLVAIEEMRRGKIKYKEVK